MSEDIKRQVLAHLNEQQAAADAREQARKAALDAAEKERREALKQYLDLCTTTIEPAIIEFQGYLDGQAITGKLSKDLEDRPYPHVMITFSSKEARTLAIVDFRHSDGENIEVRTREGTKMYESTNMPCSKVTKESVQKALLDVFKKLRI